MENLVADMELENKIGFGRIRRLLEDSCLCDLGRERVSAMSFTNVGCEVIRRVNCVAEFVGMAERDEGPDLAFTDVRSWVERLRLEGSWVEADGLFEIGRCLLAVIGVVKCFNRPRADRTDGVSHFVYPHLQQMTQGVVCLPEMVRKLDGVLDVSGRVRDGASPELARIRREMAVTEGKMGTLLNGVLMRARAEGLVGRDVVPTVRDGRLVLPVAPAMKRRMGGIVIDVSDSGRTLYVEPTEVVEANNRLRELEGEEQREVVRILRETAAVLRPHAAEISAGVELLAEVDFIQAKARLAKRMGATLPRIVDGPVVDWTTAVHPLLKWAMEVKDTGEGVVPLDIALREPEERILLISGPNAGGKSVCLKTVGLLQYMLQCGLLVPVGEGSVFGVFDAVFIDIGDEQSIENDLSTYSSHLLNLKCMLRKATGGSLVLIDEFGGGTEPQIGGAMAEAVLRRLNEIGVFGVLTTHYQNLKLFAQNHTGVVNGAMLYDRNKMQPLFRLRMGHPGSSFAIDMARKVGLPEEVIQEASDIVGSDYINADRYLQDIARDKRYWESKRSVVHQQEKRLENMIAKYETEISRLKERRREIMEEAKAQALRLIDESNARIEQTIREIKEKNAEREATKNVRRELAEFRERVKGQESRVESQGEVLDNADGEVFGRAKVLRDNRGPSRGPREVTQGSYVRLAGQESVGRVLKLNKGEALVAFGNVQTNVKLNRLEAALPPTDEKRAFTFVSRDTQDSIRKTALNFRSEIDVRGMRTDEALQAVTYFVDDALVSSVFRLRILHGTGSGILKSQIRKYLATVPAVVRCYDEHPDFGGAGITIVEME